MQIQYIIYAIDTISGLTGRINGKSGLTVATKKKDAMVKHHSKAESHADMNMRVGLPAVTI
ncbi:hypothetical protein DESC_610258 [Desulfosarcina cetonica]|nr:hypothetical protein DESC_610258 [Desulfosarcina cetonica]